MLIEFRVSNHRSIYEEQVLSMEAGHKGADYGLPDAVRKEGKFDLLTAIGIYGANASGKSNVLDAISFMLNAIYESYRLWEPFGSIPRQGFAWSEADEPSIFEIKFHCADITYQYGFALDDHAVLEEWMYAWPNGRKQVWFEREGQTFHFGSKFDGENKTIEKLTRPNALFFSTAVQNNHHKLKRPNSWLNLMRSSRSFNQLVRREKVSTFNPEQMASMSLQDDTLSEEVYEELKRTMSVIDVGIKDFRWEEDKIFFEHVSGSKSKWFPFEEESNGTQSMFLQLIHVFLSLSLGVTQIIDEIETNLHPKLMRHMIGLFQNTTTNPLGAQLIFTTHNTHLLNSSPKPLLRRDQVWLTEKGDDGATCLFPLTDVKPRQGENMEKGYLQGRYGGVPILEDFPGVGSN